MSTVAMVYFTALKKKEKEKENQKKNNKKHGPFRRGH
jgi:ribosome-binding factor A